MKNYKYYILTLVLFLLTQILLAQEKPKAPLEPEAPEEIEHEFDFEFQEFFEMKEEDEKELLKNLNETLQKKFRSN